MNSWEWEGSSSSLYRGRRRCLRGDKVWKIRGDGRMTVGGYSISVGRRSGESPLLSFDVTWGE